MQRAAGSFLRDVEGSDISRVFARKLNSLEPNTRVMVLSALGARGDDVAAPAVVEQMKADNAGVRKAALEAVRSMGGPAHVLPLARVAAGSGKDGDIAYQSLVKMKGDDIDPKVGSLVRDSGLKEGLRRVLIRLAGDRRVQAAVPALMELARDGEPKLQGPALDALASVARPKHLSDLFELLAETKTAAAEKAVLAACRRIEKSSERVRPVLDALKDAREPAVRASLIRVIGGLSGSAALEAVKDAASSSEPKVRKAAVRVLSDWPTTAPKATLANVARNHPETTAGILALRGYIDMIGRTKGVSGKQKLEAYRKAMKVASRANEKKRILSAAGELGVPGALNFLGGYLHEKSVQAEARAAYLSTARKLSATHPQAARKALRKLTNEMDDGALARRARKIEKDMQQHKGFILVWQLAGPYSEEGVGGAKLFDRAFAPEKDGEKADWRPVRGGENRPWAVDLERLVGGDNKVVYLRTGIHVSEKRTVKLELSSDDGIKAWLNGELVHANSVARPVRKAQKVVKVKLEKGWNRLMLKVTERGGNWAAAARFTDSKGNPLTDIRIDASK
jgi:HEAT repeat protein